MVIPINIPKHNYEDLGEADKYICSSGLWNKNGRTIVLLGDVWFSDEAIKTIVGYKGDSWKAFGRVGKSSYTGCQWRELFSQSFLTKHIESHKKKLITLGNLYKTGEVNISSGWAHLNLMMNLNADTDDSGNRYLDSDLFTQIDDFTDDFDFPRDYDRWIDNYQKSFNPRVSVSESLQKVGAKFWKLLKNYVRINNMKLAILWLLMLIRKF